MSRGGLSRFSSVSPAAGDGLGEALVLLSSAFFRRLFFTLSRLCLRLPVFVVLSLSLSAPTFASAAGGWDAAVCAGI